jgi:DNA (cytosine-5)-methyltransferase 1
MSAYYNEIDPYAAQWLRNLIAAGHLPAGHVDERSIEDVTPADLAGFTQCHFFAGFGGWALALRLAGWPDSRPAWTGSCPCQPFSAAGKGAGFADERHLWPAWQHLIAQCRPAVVFGEQVASKAVDPWIDLVHADLEGMGYAFGCVAFPSAGVGAPHIRDRNYWVADADGRHASAERQQRGWEQRQQPQDGRVVRMAESDGQCARIYAKALQAGQSELGGRVGDGRPGPTNGLWRAADWLACTDGKWRPVEPGAQPLAHGIPNRVGRLRAYGNAINPHQAAEFIRAYAEARGLIALEMAA